MLIRSLVMTLTLCHGLKATAIALIVTPRFAVVAADSKAVDSHGGVKADVCKIRRVGRIFYIANNFVSHSATGYNLERTIRDIQGNSVRDLAAKARMLIAGPLKKALAQSRRGDPRAFEANFAGGQATGVFFIGFEKGSPAAVDLQFQIDDLRAADPNVRVEQHSCPGAGCPNGFVVLLVPQDLQGEFEAEHPRYWIGDAATVAAAAEAFIDLAMRKRPLDVGPPVSILVIDSPKGRWLKDGLCGP